MGKTLWSVLTTDMDHCIYTGSAQVERHHLYGGPNKALSERYGFIAPLRYDLHPNGAHVGEQGPAVDEDLKKRCQEYYEAHYGTREQFIKEFGRSFL